MIMYREKITSVSMSFSPDDSSAQSLSAHVIVHVIAIKLLHTKSEHCGKQCSFSTSPPILSLKKKKKSIYIPGLHHP